jgi:hypothetical protein
MKVSTEKHGHVDVFYYKNPDVSHRHKLAGRTAAQTLNWMFNTSPAAATTSTGAI